MEEFKFINSIQDGISKFNLSPLSLSLSLSLACAGLFVGGVVGGRAYGQEGRRVVSLSLSLLCVSVSVRGVCVKQRGRWLFAVV